MMNRLLLEYLGSILDERTKHNPGDTWETPAGWAAKNLSGKTRYRFATKDAAQAWLDGKQSGTEDDVGTQRPGQEEPKEKSSSVDTEKSSTKPTSIESVMEEPDEDTNVKGVYDENDPMQVAVVEATTNEELLVALKSLADDEAKKAFDGEPVVIKGQEVIKPKVGQGGLVASTGETLCTEFQTDVANGRYDSNQVRGSDEFREKRKQLQNELDGASNKRTRASKEKYYKELAEQYGLVDSDGRPDIAAAMDIEAEHQLWVEKKDEELRTSLAGRGFPNDESRRSWLTTAFHSGYSLQIHGPSDWDRTQPSQVLKANSRTDGAVETMLEAKRDSATSQEEREHYERQLEVWKKFQSYHDTYMVYIDQNGRTTIYCVSNKKSSDLKDPHNNTTPIKRIVMWIQSAREAGLTDDVGSAKAIAEPIARAEQRARETIDNNDTIVLDSERGFLSISSESAAVVGQMARHLPGGGNRPTDKYYNDMIGNKQFEKYLRENGIDPKDPVAVSIAALKYVEERQAEGKGVPAPIFKFAVKIATLAQNIYDRASSGKTPEEIASTLGVPPEVVESVLANEDMGRMAEMKRTHARGLSGAYEVFVEDLHKIDRTTPGTDEDNGPAIEVFVRGTLKALHIDTYIENYDENVQIESGGVGTKPIDVRNCMAELSGFEGDTTTPEGRKALMDHLGKKVKVEPGSDRLYFLSSELGKDGKPKRTYVAEETWRSSGGKSKKVTSGFGADLRDCLKKKSSERAQSYQTSRNK